MSKKVHVSILSPYRLLGEFDAGSVQVPATEGYVDFRPGHAFFVAELKAGILIADSSESSPNSYFVSGGYVRCEKDNLTIMTELAELKQDIDADRAVASYKRAVERLSKVQEDEDLDLARALASLERAKMRKALLGLHS